jgi:hypothetical protein
VEIYRARNIIVRHDLCFARSEGRCRCFPP